MVMFLFVMWIIIIMFFNIWMVNGLWSLHLANKEVKLGWEKERYGEVVEVFQFYVWDWLGFRHWFQNYDMVRDEKINQ